MEVRSRPAISTIPHRDLGLIAELAFRHLKASLLHLVFLFDVRNVQKNEFMLMTAAC